MAKRLILFSGGVESTALLNFADPDDILVTVKKAYDYAMNLDVEKAEKIAEFYNKKINWSAIDIPVDKPRIFAHQMWYLQAVATLWVVKDPDITEVWCGRHTTDLNENLRPFIERMMKVWDYTHPTIKFNHPLDHWTKLQQWQSIPEEIKPLVNFCNMPFTCGNCKKCKEFIDLVGRSEWDRIYRPE